MKIRNVIFILTAFIIMFAVNGINANSQSNRKSLTTKSLTVKNEINDDVVLFVGRVDTQNMLGEVKSLSSVAFDIFSKVADNEGAFLLRVVKKSVHRAKGNRISNEDAIFTSLVEFNKNDKRQKTITIPRHARGPAEIYISNNTEMIAQIHIDSIDGPIVATLKPFERTKRVHMEYNPKAYYFFVVYKYYDRATMCVQSVVSELDGIIMMPDIPRPGGSLYGINFEFLPSRAFNPFVIINVINDTNLNISLLRGTNKMINQNEKNIINPGTTESYILNLSSSNRLIVSDFIIDTGRGEVNMISIPELTFQAGYIYDIRIRDGVDPIVTENRRLSTDYNSIVLVNE